MATSTSSDATFAPIPYSEIPRPTENSTGPNVSHGTYNPVDSALLSALRDPRERMALFKVEQLVLDFCNSQDEWLEVGGPYNSISVGPTSMQERGVPIVNGRPTSFHRCVLHRLADRFNIIRANGGVIEGSIRLIKIPESKVPTNLLRDLDPAEYAPPPAHEHGGVMGITNAMAQASVDPAAAAAGSNNNSNQTDTPQQPPRKMKIMKRSDRSRSGNPGDKKKGNPKTLLQKNSSVSDKEKAYAEARARIFNDDSDAGNSNTDGQGDDTATSSSSAAAAAATTPLPTAGGGAQSPLRRLPSNEGSSTAPLAKKDAATGSSSSLENKAVYRNRMEEAADPDFRRGVAAYPVVYYPPPPASAVTGAAAAAAAAASATTTTSYASRATAQQQQQQQQQPPANNMVQQPNNAPYYNAKPLAPPPTPPRANCMESFPPLTADAPAFYPKAASPSRPPPSSAPSVQR